MWFSKSMCFIFDSYMIITLKTSESIDSKNSTKLLWEGAVKCLSHPVVYLSLTYHVIP